MKIICNGETRVVAEGVSVEEYILSLDLDPETVVVELDEVLLGRDEYREKLLHDGCRLEIIRFVGGG